MGKVTTLNLEEQREIIVFVTDHITNNLRGIETKMIAERHERQREALKEAIRLYRKHKKFVDNLVERATTVDDDLTLRDLLDLMSRHGKEAVRATMTKEHAVHLALRVNLITDALNAYRAVCESSHDSDDMRRYRSLYNLYISEEQKTAEEIAECENLDRSTVYRDVDIAIEGLAVLFYGAMGLDSL